jgi:hypothetical protein
MNRIVLDQSAANQLAGVHSEQFELLDPSGRTLGFFVPAAAAPNSHAEIYKWLRTQISDEEIERRCHDGNGRTIAEVLERLKSA